MKLDLFAHRINRVNFGAGVVRIEFCVLPPNDKGEITPDTAVSDQDVNFTVTLPLGGFNRSMGDLRKFMQELQSKGLLKKPEDRGSDPRRRQGQLPDITGGSDNDEPVV